MIISSFLTPFVAFIVLLALMTCFAMDLGIGQELKTVLKNKEIE